VAGGLLAEVGAGVAPDCEAVVNGVIWTHLSSVTLKSKQKKHLGFLYEKTINK
jgi:hypothetical protein